MKKLEYFFNWKPADIFKVFLKQGNEQGKIKELKKLRHLDKSENLDFNVLIIISDK